MQKLSGFWFVILALVVIFNGTKFARAEDHPDYSKYQYRVVNGAVQGPWWSYPTGREKSGWTCFDKESQIRIDCSYIEDFDIWGFEFVFRRL